MCGQLKNVIGERTKAALDKGFTSRQRRSLRRIPFGPKYHRVTNARPCDAIKMMVESAGYDF